MRYLLALVNRNGFIKDSVVSSLYAASLFSRRVTSALIAFVLARYLTLDYFGVYSSFVNIAGILLIVSNFGFNEYLLVISKSDRSKVRDHIHGFFILSCALFCAALLMALFVGQSHRIIFILIMAKVFLETQVCIILLTYFQFEKKFSLIAMINISYSILVSVLVVISYLARLGLTHFLELNVAMAGIYVLTQLYFINAKLVEHVRRFKIFLRNIKPSLIYYGFVMVTVAVYMQIPSLSVSLFMLKKQAAIYFAGYNIASILFLMSTAQVQKLLPELIGRDVLSTQAIIKRNVYIIGIINLFVLLAFLVFGREILLVIYSKHQYVQSYFILVVFTLANLFLSIGSVLACYMTANGYQKYKLYFQVEYIIVGLLATSVLSSLFGISGAAYAYLIVSVYALFRYYRFVCRNMRVEKALSG